MRIKKGNPLLCHPLQMWRFDFAIQTRRLDIADTKVIS
jgi:hypothetical protein